MTHSQLVFWIQANADQLAAFFLAMPGFATIAQDASGPPSHTDVASSLQNAPYPIVAAFTKEPADERRRRLCRERVRRYRAAKRLVSVQQASRTQVSFGSDLGDKRGECEGGDKGEKRNLFFALRDERYTALQSVTESSIPAQNQGSSVTGALHSVTQALPSVTGETLGAAPLFGTQEKPQKRKGFYSDIPDELYSPNFGSERLSRVWEEWLIYRKERHGARGGKASTTTLKLWQREFRKIAATSEDAIAESVKTAIASSWALFRPVVALQQRHGASRSVTSAPQTWIEGHRPDIDKKQMAQLRAADPDLSVSAIVYRHFSKYIGRYPTGREHWLAILSRELRYHGVEDPAAVTKVLDYAEKMWPKPLDAKPQGG